MEIEGKTVVITDHARIRFLRRCLRVKQIYNRNEIEYPILSALLRILIESNLSRSTKVKKRDLLGYRRRKEQKYFRKSEDIILPLVPRFGKLWLVTIYTRSHEKNQTISGIKNKEPEVIATA